MSLAGVFKAVRSQPALVGVTCEIGDEHIDRVDQKAPRMVWVPTTDPIDHGRIKTSLNGAALTDVSQRCIYTRTANVDAHLWSKANVAAPEAADEIDAMEELVRRVLVAFRRVAVGDGVPGSLRWMQLRGESLASFGRYAVLSLSVQIPVFEKDADVDWKVTQATIEHQTGTLNVQDGTPGDSGSPAP